MTSIASLPILFAISSRLALSQPTELPSLSGDLSLTLTGGLWQENPTERTSSPQDLTLDLVCQQNRCQEEIWGYAPQFNQAEHNGTVTVVKTARGWQLRAKLNINPDPWQVQQESAEYIIELKPLQNQFIGSYTGKFRDRSFSGNVSGTISPQWPKQVENYQPLTSQEHPRLIFRASQLPELKEKAKTNYGKAILDRLQQALSSKIYYDGYVPNGGYHAAGYCFLSLLNDDPQAAETAWTIVKNSIGQPGPRLLEQAPIVAGVALAYDLCYRAWNQDRLKETSNWLAIQAQILAKGTKSEGWNGYSWSNWSARARGAAGLAILAIMDEPKEFLPENIDLNLLLSVVERNVKRYLTIAVGDRGMGSEGDLYTTEPWVLTIVPFLQAERNVLGKDFIQGSSAEWFLPHYLMRAIDPETKPSLSTYGRHRAAFVSDLFAVGLDATPEYFLPGVFWFFDRYLGLQGDRSFGISDRKPYLAIYALTGYREDIERQNPSDILGRVLVDRQKGFYVFRDRWQDKNDFVASIYLKREILTSSWSFPDAASFRIWGLGREWAKAGASDGKRESENVIEAGDTGIAEMQPIFFTYRPDGSGIVSAIDRNWLRSFAVDYGGASGTPGLFVVVDRFKDLDRTKTWIMHADGKVKIEGQRFSIIASNGATMQGTFITPVQLSFEPEQSGGKILATGDSFFVVMTVQKGLAPEVKVSGSGLDATVRVGKQTISFIGDRIVLTR